MPPINKVALVILASLVVASSAHAVSVCIDPGHGGRSGDYAPEGYNWGAAGNYCDEKDLNLKVGKALEYLLRGWNNYHGVLTRSTDVVIGLPERVAIADQMNASVFESVHHNGVPVGSIPERTTYVMYCNQDEQASWPSSQSFASSVGNFVWWMWGDGMGLTNGGAVEDFVLNQTFHVYVLKANARPAILGEGCGTRHIAADLICNSNPGQPYGGNEYRQAKGYFQGIVNFSGITSVGVSFTATPGSGAVTLQWEENDPQRAVAYQLLRSDRCWGPFNDTLAVILSHDTNYTSDNRHYQFVDNSVGYSRSYVYELRVMGEHPQASATPSGLPSASPPATPTGLAASGVDRTGYLSTVNVSWTAAAGATGYHVFRSQYVGMSGCSAQHEYLGIASGTAFQDTTAPTDVDVYYRVRAFNASGGSDVSGEALVAVPRTVDAEYKAAELSDDLIVLGPNPTRGGATLRYTLATAGTVRLVLYDVAGRVIAEPASGFRQAGQYDVTWDGRGLSGEICRASVYFARMTVDKRPVMKRRLVVIR